MTRPAPALGRADKWIGRAAAATVVGLAGIAGAISYSHIRMLAAAHGDAGWHAHAFPLSVDGVEIVASLVLLADRRAGRRSAWLTWAALTLGTAASLAANIATADANTVSRVIAGWPAVALLIAVKLLSGILEHRYDADAGQHAARSVEAKIPGTGHGPSPDRRRDAPASPAAKIRDLLPAGLAAQEALRAEGQPLTRDALALACAQPVTVSATTGSPTC